jgi:hypothetical protein
VGEYLVLEHGEARGNEIMDDIDRRFVLIQNIHFILNLTVIFHGRDF